jgi:Domain of unknown function (DUF4159)/Aerotolerance regulator N-terminal
MLDLGVLGLANPWLLTALVSLPALWWLLRIIPPAPKQIRFPAIRFLLGLEPEEETSARTPLWLLILRLVVASLVILALAGPVLNPEPELAGKGPLVLVVDDGWAAAAGWAKRTETLKRFADRAQRQNREVVLLGTAADPVKPKLQRLSAADAVRTVASWQPKPWPVDRAAALEQLKREPLDGAELIWLTDGVAGDRAARDAAVQFADQLRRLGPLRIFADPVDQRATLLLPPDPSRERLVVSARRPSAGGPKSLVLRAVGPTGEILARQPLKFDDGATRAQVRIDLPVELRNQIARFELEPASAVGGVVLLDERWRQRLVGLVGEPAAQAAQPLLSELYYVEKALAPHAELRRGTLPELLAAGVPEIVLTDSAQIGPDARGQLASWVEAGGVLLRFAGPRLANAEDDLVPVKLRRGDRSLGGALSWARPLPLASFDEGGPLAGLAVPKADVVVQRQVLAQPGPDLAGHVWARLADGTPLITGAQRGKGWLVLIHTTANTTWSSLPLSGTFVEILRRVAAFAPGAGGTPRGLLAPLEVLDAQGRLVEPGPAAEPVAAAELATTIASARHPAGLYGRLGAAPDAPRQALNLASAVPDLQALQPADFPVRAQPFAGGSAEIDLMPWLLLAALLLALADTVIGLQLRGLLLRPARAAAAAIVVVAVLPLLLGGRSAWAADSDEAVIAAISETRLAYVVTGIAEVDSVSQAGLEGLTVILNRRTAVEAAEPRAVDLAVDDLDLFPLLYWPIPGDHPDLAAGVRDKLDAYLRQGGMILFDTGDAATMIPDQSGPGPGERRLRQLLAGLNLPALEPVPEDHPLTRSFYLLQDFPGRWAGSTVWVDHAETGVNDGVSSVIIGGNGWAGAWATDEYGMAMFPVVPGGERQRELARRFGVNLVMYALTGNYKTDQVHIPALLERLGQ